MTDFDFTDMPTDDQPETEGNWWANLDDEESSTNTSTSQVEGKEKGDRGVCDVCGAPAYDGRAKKCEEHRGVKSDSQPRTKKGKQPKLEVQLQATLGPMAALWSIRDPYCGQVALNQVPELAAALAQQAENSPKLKKALTAVASPGGWLSVGAAVAPIAMAVYAHHIMPQQQPQMAEQAPTNGAL